MITRTDLSAIDTTYFQVLDSNGYLFVLRSHSTGHYWCLQEQALSGHRSFKILHRHHGTDPYHVQAYRPSVGACCAYIVQHDAFHIKREEAKQERRRRAAERRRAARENERSGPSIAELFEGYSGDVAAREMETGRVGREAL